MYIRKLARKVIAKGHPAYNTTMHLYLTSDNPLAFEVPEDAHLAKMTKSKRASDCFCKGTQNWMILQLRRVLFSVESPFELLHALNGGKNNEYYTRSTREVKSP